MLRSRTARPLTYRYCWSALARLYAGWAIQPCRRKPWPEPSVCAPPAWSTRSTLRANSSPSASCRRRSESRSPSPFQRRDGLPLWDTRSSTSGRASASCRSHSSMWPSSVRSARRNLRRAGTLKNRSRTSTVVPCGCALGSTAPTRPPSTSSVAPWSASRWRDESEKRLTEAIEGSASPRKPSVATPSRSSSEAILLVAWREIASGNSSAGMPAPSSRMRIRRTPPSSRSMSMRRAPASRAFSTSSLTTDAGRSMTSPAAIWLMRVSGSWRIVTAWRCSPASSRESLVIIADAALRLARSRKRKRPGNPGRCHPRDGAGSETATAGFGGGELRIRARGVERARRRLAGEVGVDAVEHRAREVALVGWIEQAALLFRVRDEGGLDQHRRHVGGAQNGEVRALDVRLVVRADALEAVQHVPGGVLGGLHVAALGKVEQHRGQRVAGLLQAHAADEVGGVFLVGQPTGTLRRRTLQREHVDRGSLGGAVFGRIGVDRDEHVRLRLSRQLGAARQGNERIVVARQVRLQARRRVDLAGEFARDRQGHVLLALAGRAERARILTAMAGVDGDDERTHAATAHHVLHGLHRRLRRRGSGVRRGGRARHRRGHAGGDARRNAGGDGGGDRRHGGDNGGRRRCR